MADVSIVVVSWNVREKLLACLRSLVLTQDEAEAEIVVVDNASQDMSGAAVVREFPKVKLIQSEINIGFAAACNLGASNTSGKYIVFLNPDVSVRADFIKEVSKAFISHPTVGIIGGKILGSDGNIQPSVRLFPSLWSSLLDAAKILRRAKWLAPNYLAKGFDYDKTQVVEQIMGAFFCVRRDIWGKLNGFDEKYFVWYEEVDFCRRARQMHVEVLYDPSIVVNHEGGASFSQLENITRHRLFSTSLRRYVLTHLGYAQYLMVTMASEVGYMFVVAVHFLNIIGNLTYVKKFIVILSALAVLEIMSWQGYSHILFANVVTVALASIWLVTAKYNLPLAAALLVTELVIGSQGYLLMFRFGESLISLRLALFLVAFAYTVVDYAKTYKLAIQSHSLRWAYVGALGAILWALINAFWNGNEFSRITLDVNGYLYLLIFPLIIQAAQSTKLDKYFRIILPAALLWVLIKTLVAQYLFGHIPAEALTQFYHWWRDTGFGEITYVSGSVFRIFSQSQVYGAFALSAASTYYLLTRKKELAPLALIFIAAGLVIASMSRSFWIGVSVALMSTLFLAITKKIIWCDWFKKIGVISLLCLASAGLVLTIIRSALFIPPLGTNEASAFSARFRSEAASASRLKLLGPLSEKISERPFLGSGFGKTVTYYSLDPRAVRASAGGTGLTTTFAFEWGYLDTFLKFGLIAASVFMCFIILSAIFVYRRARWLSIGLVSLFVLNITTPYLNHPLGLGLIMASVAWATTIELINKKNENPI